ncbi:MAG TPA: class F sortase, partial [Pseudonocardiaceae bacterium]
THPAPAAPSGAPGTAFGPAPQDAVAAPEAAPATGVYPTALRIPRIGVDVRGLVGLGLDATGALAAPADPRSAGWFAAGTVPGDQGPALIAGHVDSGAGPAVFFRLSELRDGDEVHVDRSDGRTVAFTVVSVGTYPKDGFPTEQVYGPTPVAELRLVTCGGPFDRAGGRYLDNVIVQAVPAHPPASP